MTDSGSEFRNILLEIGEGIATITVNRPKVLNALDSHTLGELERALESTRRNDAVDAVIVTGSGEKSFVAGADITELQELDAEGGRDFARRGQALFNLVERFPKPVLAAVNGYCLGGGCELALSCHMRVASENAVFGQPEVKLGLIPGYGGTQRVSRTIGKGMAMQLILTGEMIDSQEALRLGLINKVVPGGDLLPYCRKLLTTIQRNSPVASRLAIESINVGLEIPLDRGLEHEAALFGLACSSEDKKEGTAAFLEKRAPQFRRKEEGGGK